MSRTGTITCDRCGEQAPDHYGPNQPIRHVHIAVSLRDRKNSNDGQNWHDTTADPDLCLPCFVQVCASVQAVMKWKAPR